MAAAFFGLAFAGGQVVEGPNFAARVPDIWAVPNHNWLRITRIVHSLSLLGLAPLAHAFFDRLEAMYGSRRFPISGDTFRYGNKAVDTT